MQVGSRQLSVGRLERKEGLMTISFDNAVQTFSIQLVVKNLLVLWGAPKGAGSLCLWNTCLRVRTHYFFCLNLAGAHNT